MKRRKNMENWDKERLRKIDETERDMRLEKIRRYWFENNRKED